MLGWRHLREGAEEAGSAGEENFVRHRKGVSGRGRAGRKDPAAGKRALLCCRAVAGTREAQDLAGAGFLSRETGPVVTVLLEVGDSPQKVGLVAVTGDNL